jgi:cell division septation protein DedD
MRRLTYLLGVGLLAMQLAGSPAWAAAAPTTTTTRHRTAAHRTAASTNRHWEAIAGVFRTQQSAQALVSRLDAKGLKGYTVRSRTVSHHKRFEVERQMPDKAAAAAEVQRLRTAGFHGRTALE